MLGAPSISFRLAKINLVTIFYCDYQWYCTIDYVIVNHIGIHHLFHRIQRFLAIHHLLSIIDGVQTSGEHGLVLYLLLTIREARKFPVRAHVFQF